MNLYWQRGQKTSINCFAFLISRTRVVLKTKMGLKWWTAVIVALEYFVGRTAADVCYGANTKLYSWCQGYAKAGYSCVGDFCAVDKCIASCDQCSHKYENNVVDANTGKCCDSISRTGECVNPKSGAPTQDIETYGYLGSIGGLIVEGPVPYKNSQPVFPNPISAPSGWKANYPPSNSTATCPPIPRKGYLSKLNPALVPPMNFFDASKGGIPEHLCFLSCNISDIENGGPDPCAAGSYIDPKQNIYAPMQCYYGGPGYLSDPTLGVCGFNCTSRYANGTYCPPKDHTNCYEVCDSTKFT